MHSVRRLIVAALCVTGVLQAPAQAQSKWAVELPAVLNIAKEGMLVAIAPPSFAGCSQGDATVYASTVLPGLDLWSPVFVLDEGAPAFSMRWVYPGSGAINVKQQSEAWIRVLPYDPDADLDAFLEHPCEFYGRTPLAEGPGRLILTSADDSLVGPGMNSWGFNVRGDLSGPLCPSGVVRFSWVQHWNIKSDSDLSTARLTVAKGPLFTCR